MPARQAGESALDQLLGERRAFSRIGDSCSAADAECLRRMRDERQYRLKKLNWSQFCTKYLDISKTEANSIIRRFEEFGQSYFDVSRIVRISPESYRAYEPTAELRQVCQEAGYGCERQTIGRLARDLRQRMYDLEVLAA
jgi:hypothetical protein